MFDWLGLGAVNGWLLWGGLAVASPIIIHLLSKRRFRTVDWAAMEFLLEAERRNRRRIRLEDLLLLLLRCLAVLLIALLVARVFLAPTGLAARVIESARFERIIVLDDSPSMEAQVGPRSVFDEAKDGLVEFVRRTARQRPGDTLTLLTTSRPDRPVLSGQFLSDGKDDAVCRTIESLEVSDRSASFDTALLGLEEMLGTPRGNLNREVLVLTDFRRRDWQMPPAAAGAAPAAETPGPAAADAPASGAAETPAAGAPAEAPAEPAPGSRGPGLPGLLKRLADRLEGLAVVNVGGKQAANLAVTGVAVRDKTIVAGVPVRFDVTVTNHGPVDVTDAEVTLTAGTAVPLRSPPIEVPAGRHASVPFTFTFAEAEASGVRAETPADTVPRDNVRFFAAQVHRGVPVLLVDGEPSSEYGDAETFYLDRALAPPGEITSGNDVRVVTENQFEDMLLDEFQVIVLANVYRVTDGRVAALAEWVRAGGGLILFLGDQVDEVVYNEKLGGDAGLFPLALETIRGDESEGRWVHLNPEAANHPVLEVFAGAENPFLSRVKFFRWWGATVPKERLASGQARVLATFSDADASPAIVEQRLGDGRVLTVTTAADAEWSNWPADPSYLVTVLEMMQYAERPMTGETGLAVGSPIRLDVDPARFAGEVVVEAPGGGETVSVQAVPTDDPARLRLTYEDTDSRGFYRLRLRTHEGDEQARLFAANVDPTEGDLTPADADAFRRALGGTDVRLLQGRQYMGEGPSGARSELWRPLLIALFVVLFAEQVLAWCFGKRR